VTLVDPGEPGICRYTYQPAIKIDPLAHAYSFTQTYKGKTTEVVYSATENLNGTRGRPRRGSPFDNGGFYLKSGELSKPNVYGTQDLAWDYIGYYGWTGPNEAGFQGYSSGTAIQGTHDDCADRARSEIERDGITVTDTMTWRPERGKIVILNEVLSSTPNDPFPKLIDTKAQDYWDNPPDGAIYLESVIDGEVIFKYLLGPVFGTERLFISKATFAGDIINMVGAVTDQFDPTAIYLEGTAPNNALFTIDLVTLRPDNLSPAGRFQGEVGDTIAVYNNQGILNCCRRATTDDLAILHALGLPQ